MILIARLTVRRAAAEQFQRFEREAARILARHGAAIERTVALRAPPDDPQFVEVHLVRFPDDAALASYRDDPALAALAPLRDAAILATEIWVGDDGPSYQ
jgi:uncharacterized protein (DUF1330 family)